MTLSMAGNQSWSEAPLVSRGGGYSLPRRSNVGCSVSCAIYSFCVMVCNNYGTIPLFLNNMLVNLW